MDQEYCEAVHIISKCNFIVGDTQAIKLWDERFPGCCETLEHRVMDVRNGILLSLPIHRAFDNFELTIRKEGVVYKVETQTLAGSQQIHSFDGRTIQFNSERRHEWPREEFLKFHNECFNDKKRFLLEAAAEEYASDNDNSNETLAEMADSIKKAENWINSNTIVSIKP